MPLNDVTTVFAGSRATDFPSLVDADTDLRLMGFTVVESAGSPAAAHMRIVHGQVTSGNPVIATVKLAADGKEQAWFGPDGIPIPNGITLNFVAGAMETTLQIRGL